MEYTFEWDPDKARSNKEKHGIGFDEAASVLSDPRAISAFDPDHSDYEERWVTLGISQNGNLLVTCHTFQQKSEYEAVIRIFSSRKATKTESQQYGG